MPILGQAPGRLLMSFIDKIIIHYTLYVSKLRQDGYRTHTFMWVLTAVFWEKRLGNGSRI